ncbi:peptidyl-glycine alpha-amidating monooxygenase B isoform X1 [Stegostoma tigrinum]|uniref:peptidyl-glycine alpha-amidating monooxygenase B isoform X1 n=1 Tax=Stegostoma tigrinum TaxID=3053191 RepID=UPI0028705183|nr:peptidyl-glycine alpha-amidating monooxygenase B isoform X1 [Stegostoma tigrinum]XP_048383201.2 peptidyl-glycine alpha-amidating monooxygenase B isoform X1 [Stegostoma tigrinum]XP_048383202.2 peptidyl-glycine alpha-amidating monooxygenase B isoform X1 [Stegostoma tigrinum]XP_048383203.2 peptidyl-glycine alpha-amidating monooxygenase B isoform X1 [Stegostoma tigrinum]
MAGFINKLLLVFLILQNNCMCHESTLSLLKRYQQNPWTLPSSCPQNRKPEISPNSLNFKLDVRMPGVTPEMSDSYFCTFVPVPSGQKSYIVDFKPHASMETVHHMLLFGCNMPATNKNYWKCGSSYGTCLDEAKIMYAWARNAPPTQLPAGVGFRVGGNTDINYVVLQVHYGDVTAFRDNHKDCSGVTLQMTFRQQPLIAGIYLLMSQDTVIPPGEKVVNADIACLYKQATIHPFAFRTHTHQLGQVVSGYRVRDGKWTLIGRQSPQLPQAFYHLENPMDIKYGDTITARCVFTGKGRTTVTLIGRTSKDEMCNLYIMYYMDAKHAKPHTYCMQTGSPELFKHIPPEANIPIPVSPDAAMHGHHTENPNENVILQQPKREEEVVLDQGNFYALISKLLGEREDVVHVHKYNPTHKAESNLVAAIANVVQKKDLTSGPKEFLNLDERSDPVLIRDRVHKFHRIQTTVRPAGNKLPTLQPRSGFNSREIGNSGVSHLEEAVDWPGEKLELGQVSGVALDSKNNLVIFHRGNHVWDENSFDQKHIYQAQGIGPIQYNTILTLDPVSMKVLNAVGANVFYLPHGISTDKDDNFWVTDVALHQIFKLGPKGDYLLVLGEAFQPGSDSNHFCQPTDVVVDPTRGNFYVSDGYCNSRIIQFSPEGEFVMQWGEESSLSGIPKPGQFFIPHSLTFVPILDQLCVADRENGRIQCFVAQSGQFLREIQHPEFGSRLFAVSYTADNGGLFYAVNGEALVGKGVPVQGFVLNFTTGELLDIFKPSKEDFLMPHDIVAAVDKTVYVGDIQAKRLWKFVPAEKAEHRSVKKAGTGMEMHEIDATETFLEAEIEGKMKAPDVLRKHKTNSVLKQSSTAVSPLLITLLLIIPVVLLVGIGVFIHWRKGKTYGENPDSKLESLQSSGGILGRLRGKSSRGLNLGNFFASHRGYSRKGFDRLSTEGSDLEKDDEEGTDSETEEYSAPPIAPTTSSS